MSLCQRLTYTDIAVYRTLAQEEANIVSIALRPGMVDTSVSILDVRLRSESDVSPIDASDR